MTASGTGTRECTLILNMDERTQLLNLLQQALHDKRIEVHRTDAIDYKELVQHEEDVLRSLLEKLQRT